MQEVMEPILQIQVLGKFTLRYGETVISDEDDRSRKVWAVLAYLIYHREKIISQQELVDPGGRTPARRTRTTRSSR